MRSSRLALAWMVFGAASCSEESAPRTNLRPAAPASTGEPSPKLDGGVGTSPDAAVPVGGGDPCAGRAICDSFENRAPGEAPGGIWKVETDGDASVVVSDARAYGSGKRSVKVTTPAAEYQRAMFVAAGAPLFAAGTTAKTILYGRMMVWLENPAADGVHWTMISGEGPATGKPGVTAFSRYGGMQEGKLMANYDTEGASTDCWQHSATTMPVGRWVCFAWKLAGPTNDMRLSMDGHEIGDLTVGTKGQGCIGHDFDDIWVAPTFERAVLGWESYQPDAGHTMYIDDVILDDKPVACP